MEKEYVVQSDRPKKEKTQTMRAITLDDFDSSPGLRQDLPAPTPSDNEVLVRVSASSVNPVDNSIVSGMLKDMVEHEFPVTLGRDYAASQTSRSSTHLAHVALRAKHGVVGVA